MPPRRRACKRPVRSCNNHRVVHTVHIVFREHVTEALEPALRLGTPHAAAGTHRRNDGETTFRDAEHCGNRAK